MATIDDDEQWQALPFDIFSDPPLVSVGATVFEMPVGDRMVRIHPKRDHFERNNSTPGLLADGGRGIGADDSRCTGALLWDSSVVLSDWLVRQRQQLRPGCRCVELGAGLGLAGLTAATLGWVTTLTDRAEVLPLLEHGVATNALSNHATVAALEWGDAQAARALGPAFELVLMSDCVYEAAHCTLLLTTLLALTNEHTQVLLAADASIGRAAVLAAFHDCVRPHFSW